MDFFWSEFWGDKTFCPQQTLSVIRELQIKRTMRYHYTLLRMVTIQKTGNKLLARVQSNRKFYSLLVGLQNGTATLADW